MPSMAALRRNAASAPWLGCISRWAQRHENLATTCPKSNTSCRLSNSSFRRTLRLSLPPVGLKKGIKRGKSECREALSGRHYGFQRPRGWALSWPKDLTAPPFSWRNCSAA